jgi:hypothetical protein
VLLLDPIVDHLPYSKKGDYTLKSGDDANFSVFWIYVLQQNKSTGRAFVLGPG